MPLILGDAAAGRLRCHGGILPGMVKDPIPAISRTHGRRTSFVGHIERDQPWLRQATGIPLDFVNDKLFRTVCEEYIVNEFFDLGVPRDQPVDRRPNVGGDADGSVIMRCVSYFIALLV